MELYGIYSDVYRGGYEGPKKKGRAQEVDKKIE